MAKPPPEEPLELEYVDLDELLDAPRNPKDHDPEGLRAAIDRFGFAIPILRDDRTGRIIAGHGRRDDLRDRRNSGQTPPKGILVREGRWMVPIVRGFASRSDPEAEAAGVAFNKIGEGRWHSDILFDTLAVELKGKRPDLGSLGFSEQDLLDLRQEIGDLARADTDFLAGLSRGGGDDNPLNRHGQSRSVGAGMVEFRLPMTNEERDEAVLLLRQVKRDLDGDPSLSATLLEVLRRWGK